MKGLLIKDFCLLASQKKILVLYIVLMVFMSYTMDNSFIISYFPLIATLLSFSTISYDSFDNGMAFIMTMPEVRKNYANSKYLISFIVVTLSWFAAVAMQFAALALKKEAFDTLDLMGQYLLYLPVFMIICSIIIPIDLKYGVEKGRIIFVILFAAAALVVLAGIRLGRSSDPDTGLNANAFISGLKSIPAAALAVALCVIALIIAFISIRISGAVIQKKEY